MNKNLQEGVALATELKEAVKNPACAVVIGTPFIHLATVAELLKGSPIKVAAEHCADHEKGAYTGEVSAEMVKSTGAEYVILGHSERRQYYAESYEMLAEKVRLALANGLKVIFCIGEVKEEREAGKQNEVVKAQLEGSVFGLSAEEWKNITLAYEPVWAIGTGGLNHLCTYLAGISTLLVVCAVFGCYFDSRAFEQLSYGSQMNKRRTDHYGAIRVLYCFFQFGSQSYTFLQVLVHFPVTCIHSCSLFFVFFLLSTS